MPRRHGPPFGPDAPYCAPPDSVLRAPRLPMGALSCDSHAHICGPEHAYAYAESRIYTPPDALVPDYLALLKTLGVQRSVLVQPSVYGTDNTVLLQAMVELQRAGVECRGVAVLDESASEAQLDEMHALGVRGLRFNLVDVIEAREDFPLDAIRPLCEKIARRGWHAEFLVHVDDYPGLDTLFAQLPVAVVIGHVGYCRPGSTPDDAGFTAMLRHAAAGRCWIKLTGPYRIAPGDLPYVEAGYFARAALKAAPARVIWGTDWPHVMVSKAMPNDAALCELFDDWIAGDETLRHRVLVDNPAALYDFRNAH